MGEVVKSAQQQVNQPLQIAQQVCQTEAQATANPVNKGYFETEAGQQARAQKHFELCFSKSIDQTRTQIPNIRTQLEQALKEVQEQVQASKS